MGLASAHLCVCGSPAREWALTLYGPAYWAGGKRYSLCVDDYTPLCRRCHNRLDAPNECVRGHDLTDDRNVYWRPDGAGRQCRACSRHRDGKRPARPRRPRTEAQKARRRELDRVRRADG